MRLRYRTGITALAISAFALTACGNAGTRVEMPATSAMLAQPVVLGNWSFADEERDRGAAADPAQVIEREVAVERDVRFVVEKAASGETATEAAMPIAAAAEAPAIAATADESGLVETVVVDRKIIRTGTLGIVVTDLETTVTRVRDIVAGIPGAFVASSNIQEDDPLRVSTMTLRIPADDFDATLTALRNVGAEVIDEDTRSQDVTEQYTDLSARLRNAEATEAQLLEILERARTVEDTLDVQRELSQVRERIEVFQGQVNLLDNQTSLGTIVMRIHPVSDLILERESVRHFKMHAETHLQLMVRNEGTVELEQLEVVEHLDPGMIFVGANDGATYDEGTHTVSWTIDRLFPGEARFLGTEVRLEGDGSDMEARAEVSTRSPERDAGNNSAEATLTFHVDLGIEKDGSVAVPVGRDAEYTLVFGNAGNTDANEVHIEERLPEGMRFVRADGGGRFDADSRSIVWEFPRVEPGIADQVHYVARVEESEGRLQTDTTITSEQEDRASVDNSATTFLTALPEDVAERDVWSPGSTARESVDRLGQFGQWLADTGLTVGIIGGPILVVAAIIFWPVRALVRWLRGRRQQAEPMPEAQ